MFQLTQSAAATKPEIYDELAAQATALVAGEPDMIANAANLASLVYHLLPDLNWAGFYFVKESWNGLDPVRELVLGPFQGKPACIRIPLGRGVCGVAAETGRAQVVADVAAFPGHIACDSESRSELVMPLVFGGRVIGVLDLDSPLPGRFDDEDRRGIERIADIFVATFGE